MTGTSLVLGAPEWLAVGGGILAVAAAAVGWAYRRAPVRKGLAAACAGLKILGLAALGLCLADPYLAGTRPKPGANVFVVLVDTSRSLTVRDGETDRTRADAVRGILADNPAWLTRLGQDYDLRRYAFDTHLRPIDAFDSLTFDGTGTALASALNGIAARFQGRPVAGILLLSDGNATDTAEVDVAKLPPVYAVAPPGKSVPRDLAVARVTLNQTNFESAPVAVQADVSAFGFRGKPVAVELVDAAGKAVETRTVTPGADAETATVRFRVRPDFTGVGFYTVRVSPPKGEAEQTDANNTRLVVVDRGGGPYRVLYVSGRPNWEFKFLRRSLEEDSEVHLVGLVRVARREPKFDFRDARSKPNNPLFTGFDHPDAEAAERRDQPVLIRLGTEDGAELRTGFPQTAADLFKYHAVVLDDLEAAFFTPDQLVLLRTFVAQRGGGFLMLGGPDAFGSGRYERTPVGDVLPVYVDRGVPAAAGGDFRLSLTRDGWLQPWVRTRKTEDEEDRRLAGMAAFQSLSVTGLAKPGATVLARVEDFGGRSYPALVAQPFGKGRSAALLVGDWWRWALRREDPAQDDFERSWRQMVRWLVADVPGRVDVRATPAAGSAVPAVELAVRAVDAEYQPLENAAVSIRVVRPDKGEIVLPAEADAREAGRYTATYVARDPGAYRAVATVTGPDGAAVGRRDVGWAVQPAADEFARLEPNREYLESIAARTNGAVVDGDRLDAFVAGLANRGAPVTEAHVTPLWHRGWYFLVTVLCLAAEWGLRRRYGMA